ncbi:MAG: hypothetical protein CMJ64_13945 [Planctomycetaceae bacterium]|nr:hypothetical protein [Planctomycetaceae bacterium]
MFVVLIGVISAVALFAWRITSAISRTEEQLVPAGVEEVSSSGEFLGLRVFDETHDGYINNPWLRMAMNEGFSASTSVRQYQAESISLRDAQHDETGEAAVLVNVEVKRFERPVPAYEPVVVRRWSPERGAFDAAENVREALRIPNQEDLDRLREVWSGGRYADTEPLYASLRWLVVLVVIAGALVLGAAAVQLQSQPQS